MTTGEQTLWNAVPTRGPAPWSDEDGLPTVAVDLDRDPGRWPSVHPGIHDADGGHRAHRVAAAFTLAEAQDAVLVLEFAADRGPCPDLEITLDSRRSVHHPAVERRDRSRTGEPGPVAGHGALRIPLPAAWLTAGRHELTVTTVCDEQAATGAPRSSDNDVTYHPGEDLPPARAHYGTWFGSYLRWTGVRLERTPRPDGAEHAGVGGAPENAESGQADAMPRADGRVRNGETPHADGRPRTGPTTYADATPETDERQPTGGTPETAGHQPTGGTPETAGRTQPGGPPHADGQVRPGQATPADGQARPSRATPTDDCVRPDETPAADPRTRPDDTPHADGRPRPGRSTHSDTLVRPAGTPRADERPGPGGVSYRAGGGRGAAGAISWHVRATPFHVEHGGCTAPLVELTVNVPAGAAVPGDLAIGYGDGSVLRVPPAPAGRDFGMVRWRLPAPGFDAESEFTVRAAGSLVAREVLRPARRWTLHLIPHVHLDLGFTDTQAKMLELHCRNIDRALDRLEHDPGFRFSVDGSVVVQEYRRTRSPARIEALTAAVRAGRIGVNALHSNLLTGVTGLDDLRRALDFAGTLPPGPGPVPRYANITDVPTYTGVLPAVLRAAGVDAFVGMSNHHRAATDASDEVHLASPVRWRSPDGSEVLAHFADHYSQLRFIAADPQAVAGACDGLDRFIGRYERADYLPHDLAVIGTHADNEDLADGDTGFAARWNAAFASPRIVVSTFAEYLAAVAPLRDRLPVHDAEGGSFWEDGVAASAADAAAYRHAQATLPAAEHLSAAVRLLDDRYRPHRHALERAWEGLLVGGEHTWTWARATSHPHAPQITDQLAWKRRAIDDAARVGLDETRRALAQLADVLRLDGPGLLVYNPHPWQAVLDAEFDLPAGTDVLGADGVPLPLETLSDCQGMRRVRLPLPALPAHGYRFLPLSQSLETVPAGETRTEGPAGAAPDERSPVRPVEPGTRLSTAVWRVRLRAGDGLPVGLTHLPTGRELLDAQAPFALGELVQLISAEPPGTDPHQRLRVEQQDSRYLAPPTDVALRTPGLRLAGARAVPDGLRLRWTGSGAGFADVTLELLLRDTAGAPGVGGAGTCEVTVEAVKLPVLDMESVSVAFPFRVERPEVRYDRQLGWVEPARQHGPGASNEWLAATSAVAVTEPGGPGVVWAAPDSALFSCSDVVRGTWPERFQAVNGHLFAYVANNYWPCNTPPTQPGPVRFRYVFAPVDAFDPAAASRFGAQARLRALAGEVTPLDRFPAGRTTRHAEGTVLDSLAGPDCRVTLTADTGDTLTARLANLRDEPADVGFRVPPGCVPADPTAPDGTTDDATDDALRATAGGILTVRLAPYGLADVELRRLPDAT